MVLIQNSSENIPHSFTISGWLLGTICAAWDLSNPADGTIESWTNSCEYWIEMVLGFSLGHREARAGKAPGRGLGVTWMQLAGILLVLQFALAASQTYSGGYPRSRTRWVWLYKTKITILRHLFECLGHFAVFYMYWNYCLTEGVPWRQNSLGHCCKDVQSVQIITVVNIIHYFDFEIASNLFEDCQHWFTSYYGNMSHEPLWNLAFGHFFFVCIVDEEANNTKCLLKKKKSRHFWIVCQIKTVKHLFSGYFHMYGKVSSIIWHQKIKIIYASVSTGHFC